MRRLILTLFLLVFPCLGYCQGLATWVDRAFAYTAWRGETVNAEAMIAASADIASLTVEAGALRCGKSVIPSSAVKAAFLSEVVGDALLDGYNQCGNRDTVRFQAIRVPDMIDTVRAVSVSAGNHRQVWLSIAVPEDTAPGSYKGSLTFHDGAEPVAVLSYTLRVGARVLPSLASSPFHLDLWQNPYAVARYYGVPLWSKEHFDYMRPVMKLLAGAGQKVITATVMNRPWNGQTEDPFGSMVTRIRRADGSWLYDYTVFDMWVEFMSSLGIDAQINCYSMIPWALDFDFLDQACGEVFYIHAEPGSEAYSEYWEPFIRDFAAHLRAKGWFEKTHIAMDERSEEAMTAVLCLIKRVEPEFKIALAGNYHESIADNIDDLCITFGSEYPEGIVDVRRQAGQISTIYTCCAEGYPNTFLASNPYEASWLPLTALSRGVEGYLRWAYNSWTSDPVKDARFRTWAAGDCYMVYPNGRSSVRFERLKEGLSDYLKVSVLLREWDGSAKGLALRRALDAFTLGELESNGPEPALKTLRKLMERAR